MKREELDILLQPYSDYIFEEYLNDDNFSCISLVFPMKEKKSIPIFIKFYRDIVPHIYHFGYFKISTRKSGLYLDVAFIRKK